jgi:hypothetical protein
MDTTANATCYQPAVTPMVAVLNGLRVVRLCPSQQDSAIRLFIPEHARAMGVESLLSEASRQRDQLYYL